MMRLSKLILLFFFSFLLHTQIAAAEGLSNECEAKKLAIQKIIDEGGACQKDDDCTVISMCPFGCHIPIGKTSLPEFEKASRDFQQTCQECKYRCIAMEGGVACVQNKCKMK